MIKIHHSLFYLFLSLIFSVSAQAQPDSPQTIDSLTAIIKSNTTDSIQVKALLKLSEIYRHSDIEKCNELAQTAFTLATKLNYKKGIAKSNHLIGFINYAKGDYSLAREKYNAALILYQELHDIKGIGEIIYNLGIVYVYAGEYDKAQENFFKTLKIYESLDNKKGISDCFSVIASVYGRQNNQTKELEYHNKALKIKLELNEKYGISACYINIGNIYGRRKQNDTALSYYFKALKLAEELQNKKWMLSAYGNIGTIYTEQAKYKEALVYLNKSLSISEESGDKQGIIETLNSIAGVYFDTKVFNKAKEINEKALKLATEIGSTVDIKISYENLASVNAELGNYKEAYHFHTLYSNLKDTLLNTENNKQISEMGAKYETEKKDSEIKLLNKDKEIQLANFKQQQIISWSIASGLLLVLVLAFFIFRQYQQKQKANIALQVAYHEIEEKNKDITDSINYARRIQTAILPGIENIRKHLPDTFVYYQPKDIVSGDFYWFTEKNGFSIIAVADCTGHGVPGAFMSMIGNDLLTQIIIEKGITQPSMILSLLHDGVKNALKQDDELNENKDGMDIIILKCSMKEDNYFMEYSGALRPLWFIPNNSSEVIEYKPDKYSIGGSYSIEQRQYTNHMIPLKKGDTFYLSSDGYADQFGGENGKKFMSKNLKELLISIQPLTMEQQKNELQKSHNTWKNNRQQVDDILVIGIRI